MKKLFYGGFKLTPRGQILAITGSLLLLCAAAQGCRNNNKGVDRSPARELYGRSLKLLRLYTDSTKASRDSATLLALAERFDKKLTNLNYEYPPETTLMFTEGENDTVIRLTARYVELRDSLLYRFAHPLEVRDTVASDSLPGDTTFISHRSQSKDSIKV